MTTNINADDGVVSGVAGLKTSADNSGVLALQTNGTTALTVNASQALGVGSTPSYGTSGQVLTSGGSSAAPTWTTVGGGSSQWTTSGSNIYYNTGNVGIGTSSPTLAKLQVAGTAYIQDTLTISSVLVNANITDASGSNITLKAGNSNLSVNQGVGYVTATVQGVERMRLNSTGALVLSSGNTSAGGVGITFPATQSASSDANTLDDYEEGTWTPSVGGTATYNAQNGSYIKIGQLVYVFCYLNINVIGTGSTTTVSGLPFNVRSSAADRNQAGSINYFNGLATSVVGLFCQPISSSTTVNFPGLTASSNSVVNPVTVFQGGTQIYFSATYQTNT